MAEWQSSPGHTLLVPSGPSGLHLFVLVLGPVVVSSYGTAPQLSIVSATSIRDGIPHDTACELYPGEHPFIQHPSYIAYRHLRIDSAAHVEKMISSAMWAPHEPCADVLLQRIVAGVCKSKLTPREFKQLFGCF